MYAVKPRFSLEPMKSRTALSPLRGVPPLLCCLLAGLALASGVGQPAAWPVSPDADLAQGGWPEFRGPRGNGMATKPGTERGVPVTWSETENIVWKTEIPFRGWSTPVILEGRVWLTTATEDGHDFYVICVDAATGTILYNERLFHADNPEPLGNDVNSYASPTVALEPGRAYVHFGSYGTACLDAATRQILWKREDLPCRHYRGPGSSPIVFENLLVLTFDGADVQYLTALDKNTGETVWKTDRTTEWKDLDEQGLPQREGDFRKAFTTPCLVFVNEVPLLVSPGSYGGFAYEARTGKEVWKTRNEAYSPSMSPIQGDGLVYMTNGRGPTKSLWAMRPDGHGDVTDSHLAWKLEGRLIPEEPSPILLDGVLYIVSNDGAVTCIESATGAVVWSERIGGNYMASPIYADGRLYCCSTQGRSTVLKAGRSFEKLAVNTLDEGCLSSPAVDGKALILRTKTHLYRIESSN